MSIQCPVCLTDNPDNQTSCIACGEDLTALVVVTHKQSSPTIKPNAFGTINPVKPLAKTVPATDPNTVRVLSVGLPLNTILNGKYKIQTVLGQGGFGITYRGIDIHNSQIFAIKELWPENGSRVGSEVKWPFWFKKDSRTKEEQIEAFVNEAEYLKRCKHPSIAKHYEHFEENNTAYIIMDFVEGKPLSKLIDEKGKLTETEIKDYFYQITEALGIVHAQNILHRDIKPDNILITSQKSGILSRAVLIDFGAAREFRANQSKTMTKILTPGYAPLEQYLSNTQRGPYTDFYALCATIYHAVTGDAPPDVLERNEEIKNTKKDLLIPPIQQGANITPLMEEIILIGLEINAKYRFGNAAHLLDALNGNIIPALLRDARELVKQNRLPEAVKLYEEVLIKYPDNFQALIELAQVLVHVDINKAEKVVTDAIKQSKGNKSDGVFKGVLGIVNCQRGNWQDAVKYLQDAEKSLPEKFWIRANLALALGKLGNWQQAESILHTALNLDEAKGNYTHIAFGQGLQAWIAVHRQKWKESIQPARQAIFKSRQLNSQQATDLQRWVYPCLTVALEKALTGKQSPDVEICLKQFSQQLPNNAFVLGYQGWQLAQNQSWRDAVTYLEQAQNKSKVSSWALLDLGIIYEIHLQDLPNAIQAYQSYIQKFTKDVPAYAFASFRLGTLLGKQQQWKLAIDTLNEAIKLKSDYAEAWHNLGWAWLNIAKEDEQSSSYREMDKAYKEAMKFYEQQGNMLQAESIKQALHW